MHLPTKSLFLLLLSISFVLFLTAYRFEESKPNLIDYTSQQDIVGNSSYHQTARGTVIDWQSGLKLKQADFKAIIMNGHKSAVATTASAFGYSITDYDGEISGSIYVRFYCNESWWNPDFIKYESIDYVLAHEQLHFDICELFGRKLYKEIMSLRNSGRLNEKTINRLHSKLEKQYSNYQNKYDKDTEHSINKAEQRKWNKQVREELNAMAKFSNYHSF